MLRWQSGLGVFPGRRQKKLENLNSLNRENKNTGEYAKCTSYTNCIGVCGQEAIPAMACFPTIQKFLCLPVSWWTGVLTKTTTGPPHDSLKAASGSVIQQGQPEIAAKQVKIWQLPVKQRLLFCLWVTHSINKQSAHGQKQWTHFSVCLALQAQRLVDASHLHHRLQTVLGSLEDPLRKPRPQGPSLSKHPAHTGEPLRCPTRQQHLFVL